MKRLKQTAALLFAGFLMFAPPGTLIVLSLVVFGLLGRTWFVVAVVVCLAAFSTMLLLRRRRARASFSDAYRSVGKLLRRR